MLLTHTYEEFATLATLQKDHTCPSYRDVSGVALLHPSQIQHYVYGEWQGTLEIQECLDGIFKVLQLDPAISLLRQPELDRILCLGEAPTRWTHSYHFPPPGDTSPATIPIFCCPWHNGACHFVTFYMCLEYWSILDLDALLEPTRLHRKLHMALRESFSSRNQPTPPLPSYR